MNFLRLLLNYLFRNFFYKISSLLLALLIWGIVQGEEVLELNRRIKVNISVANGYAIKGKPYRYIDATLRGPRVLVGELANQPIEAKIFIPSGETGNLEVPFDKRYIKDWDSRIKLTLRDTYLNVFVDEKITRKVPVREVLRGTLPEGYLIEKVIITPSTVEITGLRSELKEIEEIATEPIDITDLKQSKSIQASLMADELSLEERSADTVKVQIQIGDSKINKRFNHILVEAVGSEYLLKVRPRYVSIVIQGTPGVLSFVTREDLRAFVEVANLSPGTYERNIQVKIPPDTVLIETFPQKGSVEILNSKRVQ